MPRERLGTQHLTTCAAPMPVIALSCTLYHKPVIVSIFLCSSESFCELSHLRRMLQEVPKYSLSVGSTGDNLLGSSPVDREFEVDGVGEENLLI